MPKKHRVVYEKPVSKISKGDPRIMPGMACRLCSGPIVKMPWNSVTDITYCNNSSCSLYHTPIQPEKSYAERVGTGSVKIKDRLERLRILFMERDGIE